MEILIQKAKDIYEQFKPVAAKIGPHGAWFAAGFAAAKLLSCLVS